MTRRVFGVLLAMALVAACSEEEPAVSTDAPTTTAGATSTTTTTVPPTTSTSTTTTATTSTTTTTVPPAEDWPVLYLNLTWHQHQPRYPLDENGVVTRPWVRAHATKDYYDMAALLEQHPELQVTFNLTPGLLLQIEELVGGAKDSYWVAAEIPADELGADEQRFLMERFFDVNPKVIDRFPRYRELADKRTEAGGFFAPVETFDEGEYRDLQVLFNLAWTDPSFLAAAPLDALVEKGREFSEEDKAIVFEEHLRISAEVIPIHQRLWESGQVEITTTPLAHPILPLIADTSIATVGDPTAVLPSRPFRHVADADLQVQAGLDTAERLLGSRPAGMWPGEGSVAELVMWLFSKNEVDWVSTGEEVLANSIGLGSFTRDSNDLVQEADQLYRPRLADVANREPVAMFFRDGLLSDLIGFEYSQTPAEEAADDFMNRLEAIRGRLAELDPNPAQPYIVSVILDGENAWEHYPNDGIDFLNALYSRLTASDTIETITPSGYLERFGDLEVIPEVYPGAWFQPNYATWIGEPEEATAWDYLFRTRDDFRDAEMSGEFTPEQLEAARTAMLFAEGSDWFWFFGADQDSGQDGYFDAAFRELLGSVYDALGLDRPPFVDVPIIPATPVEADAAPADLITVEVDDTLDDDDWAGAGRYDVGEGGLDTIRFGFGTENLYMRFDTTEGANPAGFQLYLGAPQLTRTRGATLGGTVLGFGAGALVEWTPASPETYCLTLGLPDVGREDRLAECEERPAGFDGTSVELAVPLEDIGPVEAGDRVLFSLARTDRAGEGALFPGTGPALAVVPDISNVELFLEVDDPADDDHGPGSYVYPTDDVFIDGSYDLIRFEAGTEGDELVMTFVVDAVIRNPWASPSGLAVQTFDIYVDTDPGEGTGARLLIDGRNAALEAGNGWEYGITVEGWQPAIYLAEPDGSLTETTPSFKVAVLGDKGKVIVRMPLGLFGGGDPATWGYAVALMSQEGFPSPGVRRVRDVGSAAEQWVGGGGPGDANHTRIYDLAWPAAGVQEDLLSGYPPSDGPIDDLGPDDFPQVPLLSAG
jgi:alpha-amylase/alpha-mannosidase (GH57 family)